VDFAAAFARYATCVISTPVLRTDEYRHTQPFVALWVALLLTALVTTVLALRQADAAPWGTLALTWVLCASMLLLGGRLTIALRGNALCWSFGYVGWPQWQLGVDEIARTDVGRPSAWRGAGIRVLGSSNRLYNVSIGGPALQLTLHDGRRITLGTPEPDRLDAALQVRMRER
jgi:hypothetical protein